MSTRARTTALTAIWLLASAHAVMGQDWSRYRDFQLLGTVSSVSRSTGVAAADIKIVHSRPALMQELQWRRGYSLAAQADPVRQIVFSFYDDQLSRMVVDYDNDRTTGMTDADMIEAISVSYGARLKPAPKNPRVIVSQIERESGDPIARWGDADSSVVLYRTSFGSGFRLLVTAPKLESLARTAEAQAARLDSLEAPQREAARQKQEVDDTRVSQEKARQANKAAFRP